MLLHTAWLHPFGDGDPCLILRHFCDTEIAQAGAAFGDEDLLGFADDLESLGIDFRHEQRRTVPEHVVVVGAAAGVDKKQSVRRG